MAFKDKLRKDIEVIKEKAPNIYPKFGFILGSGLGALADEVQNKVIIPYHELPDFPVSKVKGHEGSMILGKLEGIDVVILKGRVHLYEGTSSEKIKILIRTLDLLNCKKLIITNAAGSTNPKIKEGEIVLITDHINCLGTNPLVGPNDEEFGPRFVSMQHAYDLTLQKYLKQAAKNINISLHEGVYLATLGPVFETPAEIKAYTKMGADLVGMSTIPEVIVADHCGMKVAAISSVTNLAAGLSKEELSHEHTLKNAKLGAAKLIKLIREFLKSYGHEA